MQLKNLLKTHLHPTLKPIAERFKFNSRYQKNNETVLQFVAVLRALTEHCEFRGVVDDTLRDRLVCGTNNKKIQQRLLSEGCTLTFVHALQLALALESTEESSSTITSLQNVQHATASQIGVKQCTQFNKIN